MANTGSASSLHQDEQPDGSGEGSNADMNQHGSGAYSPAEQTARSTQLTDCLSTLRQSFQTLSGAVPIDQAGDPTVQSTLKVLEVSATAIGLLTHSVQWLHEQTVAVNDKVNNQKEMSEMIKIAVQGRGDEERVKKPTYRIDVSNHKGISSMKNFNNDRDQFQTWNDKLINNLSQLFPGTREILKQLNAEWADHNSDGFEKKYEVDADVFKKEFIKANDENVAKQKIKEDVDQDLIEDALYYVLMEKTEGNAAIKVKSVDPGQGLRAYYKIFAWYVKTSGQALGARARRAGQPEAITKEETMFEQIEAWEQDVKVLSQYGSDFTLNPQTQLLALESLMVNFKADFEQTERSMPTDIANKLPTFRFP